MNLLATIASISVLAFMALNKNFYGNYVVTH